MNLARLPHDAGALVDFYQEALEHLGAICDRTWFDRLQLVAENRAARLWNDSGALHETELHFPPPDSTTPRDAAREVFPGCPLTFRLAETLLPATLTLERAVLATDTRTTPPTTEVAEKLWRAQWPDAHRWRMERAFAPAHHFSLLALVRGEIQAIDQHWSLHRLAIALPGGEPDETLAAALDFAELSTTGTDAVAWPVCDTTYLSRWLGEALSESLAGELGAIRRRQEGYLRRELERVDQYFAGYERELSERAARSHSDTVKLKLDQRLAAAKAEHTRRRADQLQRHEIRILPRLDALLLVAEPAWQTTITTAHHGATTTHHAHYVPRCRRWFLAS